MKKILTILMIFVVFLANAQDTILNAPEAMWSMPAKPSGFGNDTAITFRIENANNDGWSAIQFVDGDNSAYIFYDGDGNIYIPALQGIGVGSGGYWLQTGSDIYYNTGKVWVGTNSGDSLFEVDGSGKMDYLLLDNQIKITGGSPGADKLLKSDADGLATWESFSSFIGFGGDQEIPFTNATGDQFEYENGFEYSDDNNELITPNLNVTNGYVEFAGTKFIHTTGNNNTFLGSQAGNSARSGDAGDGLGNVCIGTQAGYNIDTANYNIFLGYQAGYNETGNYKLYIDPSSTAAPLIYGDFSDNYVTINGELRVTNDIGKSDIDLDITADEFGIIASDEITITGSESIGISASKNLDFDATDDIFITSTDDMSLRGDDITITSETNDISATTFTQDINLTSGRDFNVSISNDYNLDVDKDIVIDAASHTTTLSDNYSMTSDTSQFHSFVEIDSSLILNNKTIRSDDDYIFRVTSGDDILIGENVAPNWTIGSQGNIVIGNNAGNELTTNQRNVLIGGNAGSDLTGEVDGNVLIGYGAGKDLTDQENNTFIGRRAGYNSTSENSVFLGHYAGYSASEDSILIIENSSTNNPLIYGKFNDRYVKFNTDSVKMQFDNDYLKYYEDGDTVRINTGTKPVKFNNLLIPSSSSTSGVWEVNGDKIYYNDGNVGINTDNPQYRLDVEGYMAADTIEMKDSVLTIGDAVFLKADYNDNQTIGIGSGGNLSSGAEDNLFIGKNAGHNNITGDANVAIGLNAGYSVKASNNIFIGTNAGYNTSFAGNNIFLGTEAGYNNTSGIHNLFFGLEAGKNNTTGRYNIAYGTQSGTRLTSGDYNIMFGYRSGYNLQSGDGNLFFGYNSGYTNVNGSNNVFIGYESGYNETGSNKLYIANSNTSTPLIYGEFDNDLLAVNGVLNVRDDIIQFNGSNFIQSVSSDNIFIGIDAGSSNSSSSSNIFIGKEAGYHNQTGNNNVIIGKEAGKFSTNSDNVIIGSNAGYNTTGTQNTFIGTISGASNTSGLGNSYFGFYAGYSNTTGRFNVSLGNNAGYSHNGDSSVFIGFKAGYYETGSNKLIIANQSYGNESNARDSSLIYGEFDNDFVRINDGLQLGNHGITTYSIKKTLISDSILVSNTRPQELIPNPGSGKIINIVSCAMYLDYGGTAFDTNTDGIIEYESASGELFFQIPLTETADTYKHLEVQDGEMFPNSNIQFTTLVGNPANGTSDITFYITYQIIEL